MAEELLVNVSPQETRVAVVENGILQEIIIERDKSRGLVGNIYLGRVSRVLPGMHAAFVDIGLERTAFLHASKITGPPANNEGGNDLLPAPEVDRLVHEGEEILVQVAKDPLGGKGARLTTYLSVPSRYVVYMPGDPCVGVSQKIEDEAERARLREIICRQQPELNDIHERLQREAALGLTANHPRADLGGFIVRTAAEGVAEEKLVKDMEFLQQLWAALRIKAQHSKAPSIVYEDLPLLLRTLRNATAGDVEKIRIDSHEAYRRVLDFAAELVPDLVERVEHYTGSRPILDLYSVEDEIQKALERKVELKSGGYLIIDQTEAMTTVDVNTGAFVGSRNLEETIFKTNLEAAQTIARQLRLRNLGGIIIVDFIDMSDPEHQRQVLKALENHLARDHSKVGISEITSLGLVQITRKRTRESLEHTLCVTCPTCHSRGSIKSADTVCYEILREILREARQYEAQKLLVVASQAVVDKFLDEESSSVAEMEELIGRPIKFQVEQLYGIEQYDVVLL
ncbi:MAG: Rne/Rng family ribonuclease [Gammaproteobacteria bacterium]